MRNGKIKTRFGEHVSAINETYDIYWRRNRGSKKGRSLVIDLNSARIKLNGTQINTLKRVLKEAGEI